MLCWECEPDISRYQAELDIRSGRGATYWFDDPLLPGALVPGLAQQLDVLGQDEGPRDEAELLLAEADLHLGHVPPEPVLPADLERSREVVQLREERTGGQRVSRRREF